MSLTPEAEWLARIRSQVPPGLPGDDAAHAAQLALVETALVEHPRSVRLWNLRGDLIQTSSGDFGHSLDDARESYEKARTLDPADPEAWESLGYFFDVVDRSLPSAEAMFRGAIERQGGPASWAGLAWAVAEQGRPDEALALLQPDVCPYADAEEVVTVREEIEARLWTGNAKVD